MTIDAFDDITLPSRLQPADEFDQNAEDLMSALALFSSQANALQAALNAIAAGGAMAIPYTFDSDTADTDPTAGRLKLNNATQNTATVMRLDLVGSDGVTWTTAIDQFDDSDSTLKGYIRLVKATDPTKILIFSVSALASPAGYKNITVSNILSSSASPFTNGDPLLLYFDRTGDKGATGAAGSNGSNGADGSPKFLSAVPVTGALLADVDTTFDATYDTYLIIGTDISVSDDGAGLRVHFKVGGAYDSGANYKYHSEYSNAAASTYQAQANTSQSYINAMVDIGNAAAESANIVMWVFKPSSTTKQKVVRYFGTCVESGGNPTKVAGVGSNTATTALTGIRFHPSVGTFTGTFRLYGIKNS